MSAITFLGSGWSYPIVPGRDGALAYTEGPHTVAQAIWIVLDTEPGERVMRPTFGCGLRRYLMAPNTTATRALIKHDVQIALANFEPRITVSDVQVTPGDDPALVLIRVAYVTVRENRPGNLVYPFFLE